MQGIKVKCERECPTIQDNCGAVFRNVKNCCPWQCIQSQTSWRNSFFQLESLTMLNKLIQWNKIKVLEERNQFRIA